MLNNLIRFVANTKAKASEVNYNFDQVKAKIQELDDWKTNTDDKLSKYSSFQLFDLIVTDRVLTGEEAKGKLLQGSLVTNLYPDAVAKIKNEWDNGAEQTYTYGEDISFPYRLAANRHMIVDILYKDDVDALFAATGVAWFYIWDNANEQFYLPRSLWFDQYTNDPEQVNKYNEAGLPNIKQDFLAPAFLDYVDDNNFINITRGGSSLSPGSSTMREGSSWSIDASRVNALFGKSNTVQPPSSNKLLYFVVGNTYVNQEDIDLAQLETGKANINADNFSDIGKETITEYGAPSNRCDELTLLASGQKYSAPASGYFIFMKQIGTGTYVSALILDRDTNEMINLYQNERNNTNYTEGYWGFSLRAKKGDNLLLDYNINGSGGSLMFIYAEGVK